MDAAAQQFSTDKREKGADARMIPCPYCEAGCRKRELLPEEELRCVRCGSTVLLPIGKRTLQPTMALSVTGLFLLLLANTMPVLNFEIIGRVQSGYVLTGVVQLCEQGYWPIALLVLFAGVIAPGLYLGSLFYISSACVLRLRFPRLAAVFRFSHAIAPWNLIPVYSVATVVAVVKLRMMGGVEWQPGARWILGVAVMSLLCGQSTEKQIVEESLEEMGVDVTSGGGR